MMMQPNSLVYRRAKFATHNLWVTPYDDDQMFPAGNHVVQSQKCMGLDEWNKQVRGQGGKGAWQARRGRAVCVLRKTGEG